MEAGIASGIDTVQSPTPPNLIAGEFPRTSRKALLKAGQQLTAGAVLGMVSADGSYLLSASAATDGSQEPDCILSHDADSTTGDIEVIVYFSGEFNQFALTVGAGHDLQSITDAFRNKSIFFRANLAA